MPLSPIQVRGLAMLVAGKKIVDVAAALNINERTVRRWKQEPEFAQEFDQEIESVQAFAAIACANLEQAKADAASESLKFLTAQLKCEKNSAQIRLRCCTVLQSLALQSARAAEARKWRLYVHVDRKTERARLKAAQPRNPAVPPGQREDPTANPNPPLSCENPPAPTLEFPDKSGHPDAPVNLEAHPAPVASQSPATEPPEQRSPASASKQSPPLEKGGQGGSVRPPKPTEPNTAPAPSLEFPDKSGHSETPVKPEIKSAQSPATDPPEQRSPTAASHQSPPLEKGGQRGAVRPPKPTEPSTGTAAAGPKPNYHKPNHVPFYARVARRR